VCGLRGEIAHAHLHPYHGWPQDDPIEIKRHERPIPRKLAARKRSRCIALDPYGRNVDDPAHGSPHAGREQSRGSLGMHAFCPIPGTVLKHARAVHHCINASEMRQPVRRIDACAASMLTYVMGTSPGLGVPRLAPIIAWPSVASRAAIADPISPVTPTPARAMFHSRGVISLLALLRFAGTDATEFIPTPSRGRARRAG
jgi:hypothetical protein